MGTKRFTAAEGYTARELLVYARDHMASARVLFDTSWECHDSAGYLCHLGLELLIKAALLYHSGRFPDSHDLNALLSLVQPHDKALTQLDPADAATLRSVNAFAANRYPHPTAAIEIGDEDWPRILRLWRSLAERLPPVLQRHLTTKAVPTPEHLKDLTDGQTVIEKGNRILMRRRKLPERTEHH